jgi:hypothetical protein
MSTLGPRLKEIRREAGLSQARMAAELGLRLSDIAGVETGLRTFVSANTYPTSPWSARPMTTRRSFWPCIARAVGHDGDDEGRLGLVPKM